MAGGYNGADAAVTHVVSRIHSPRPFSRTIRVRAVAPGLDGRTAEHVLSPFLRLRTFPLACRAHQSEMWTDAACPRPPQGGTLTHDDPAQDRLDHHPR